MNESRRNEDDDDLRFHLICCQVRRKGALCSSAFTSAQVCTVSYMLHLVCRILRNAVVMRLEEGIELALWTLV